MKNRLVLLLLVLTTSTAFTTNVVAQNLDSLLDAETKTGRNDVEKVFSTFKGTRVSNGHSIETLPKKVLDIKIQHRFGYVSDGWKQFFGLDNATIRIGADYGISERLMVGMGRASLSKQWDAYAKYKILEQQTGKRNIPVTVAAVASGMIQTLPNTEGLSYKPHFSDRLYYAGQLLIARKFGDAFSLQLAPTIVHYNIVPNATDPNDVLSIGAATSIKLTKRTAFNIEYYYNLPGHRFDNTKNVLSMGFDIETGGHVFQFMLTNGLGIAERPFISETTGDFFKGDVSLGFNISRAFEVGSRKKAKARSL